MNRSIVCVWICLAFVNSLTHGAEGKRALTVRVSTKEQCLVNLPVACKVWIRNEGAEKLDVFRPSRRGNTLTSAVRKVGDDLFQGPIRHFRPMFVDREAVSLMPGEEIGGWINLWDMLPGGLPVGEYECLIHYIFGVENDDEIEGWSNKFRVIEPTREADKRANNRLIEITTLLGKGTAKDTQMALERLFEFGKDPEMASQAYLAQARLLTCDRLLYSNAWHELARQLEEVRRAPPEWMSIEEILFKLGYAYYNDKDYDRAISLFSGLSEPNRTARLYLTSAKQEKDNLRKDEGKRKDSEEKAAPHPPSEGERKTKADEERKTDEK